MYDTIKCLLLSGTVTLFANVPDMFELPVEKIGFGVLLFFIIWTYLKQILPKTQADMEAKNKRIEQLLTEVSRLNELRSKDQKIIAALLKEVKQNAPSGSKLTEAALQNTDSDEFENIADEP
jgi:uncharacterized protein YwgA